VRVLVDTPVWSLALRRHSPAADSHVAEMTHLVQEGRVGIVGPIRQEILSGIRDRVAFDRLRDHLHAFPDEPLRTADYERAAEHFNACRAIGLQGSNTDFLLCAIAERCTMPILTTDADFARYAKVLPIRLHTPRI
jgi:predicted nucleic acid-binding protein